MSRNLLAIAVVHALFAGMSATSPLAAQELRRGPEPMRPRFGNPDDEHRKDQGRCDLENARDVARDQGLRSPKVTSMREGRIVIRGDTAQGPKTIVFANRRGCPIVD
jgi:hypothetical protein